MMEVDGKEFLRNLSLEQDKERLIQEQKRLEALKRESVMKERKEANSSDDAAYVNLSSSSTTNPYKEEENVIEDLMLEPENSDKNKKRYILLGIGLILLFIITILVIRLVSNSETQNKMENLNPQENQLAADKILDKIDTNEEYQKLINQREALEEIQKQEAQKNRLSQLEIPNETTAKTPLVVKKEEPVAQQQRDLFGLTKEEAALQQEVVTVEKTQPTPTPVVQKVQTPPKPVVTKAPVVQQPITTTTKTENVAGFYIQIGAFTKAPAQSLLRDIQSKGYNYAVHPVTVKGTLYNKVLIGAYPTREVALRDLDKVKKDFNNKNAYILKF